MFRKSLFWMHLSAGVIASAVILMMSVTGVILTYERQIQVWEDGSYYNLPAENQSRLSADELLASANSVPEFEATSVAIYSNPAAPAIIRMGRSSTHFMNPYTGEIYAPHNDSFSAFFSTVRGIHRWFNISGENRQTARNVTGASNLLFLFLLISGIYLWFPKVIGWASFKVRIFFNPLAKTTAARDFNWHHVFGFWAAIPLLVIISTATVFNYTWANNLVYQLAGESPPVRGQANNSNVEVELPVVENPLPIAALFENAENYSENWQVMTLALPAATATSATITIDEGDGGQPQKRHTLSLDRRTGQTLDWAPFQSRNPGYKARRWVRFLHTGEALGIFGQTIAGLASIAASLMVWTGIALAFRRFIRWRARVSRTNITNEAATEN